MGSIAGALPELVAREAKLRAAAAARGIAYRIADFGGLRTETDTALILTYRRNDYAVYAKRERAAGRVPLAMERWRPIAPFGRSMHNYGAAFDLYPVKWPAGKTVHWAHDQLDAIAPTVGLRTGDSFNDEPHMELPFTLAEARRRWLLHTAEKNKTAIAIATSLGLVFLVAALR